MDPCPFVRLVVGNLASASPPPPNPPAPASTPPPPLLLQDPPEPPPLPPPHRRRPPPLPRLPRLPLPQTLAATFHLTHSDVDRLASKSIFSSHKPSLKISVYSGRRGTTCGINAGRLLGSLVVPLDLQGTQSRACTFQNGWLSMGKHSKKKGDQPMQFHLSVRAEPDPRFVFQFDGEPECSPQVFQIQGTIRQPVFTCKFSFRSSAADRNIRSRSSQSEQSSSRSWLSSLGSERERPGKERKGWSITVHDINGSPVATASMVTPFVASAGSDRVSRSNPGAWLILRPGDGTWKPWGRLEAGGSAGAATGSDTGSSCSSTRTAG
ncbi:hypothetical protein Syun_004451 [Stephania yunnanensis]|uniref:Formin-like protein 18 n=1 Tax=Stephania yunnanensis TaxID=152371 RepID=A0AAP0L6D0_9MAGN